MHTSVDTARTLRHRLRQGVSAAGLFARDASGNIALLTALMLVPIVGMAGLGVDYWTKTNAKAELDAAADAATLAAVTRASEALKAGQSVSSAIASGRAAGVKQFAGNAGKVPLATAGAPTIELAVVGQTVSSKLVWTATSKATFGSIVGVSALALGGESAAEVTMPDYVKIIMLLDNSASMGIGSTHEQQRKIHNLTGNCALACHQREAFVNAPGYGPDETSYGRAYKAGVETRIDVLRAAVKKITVEARAATATPRQIKIGLYTYNSKPQAVLGIDDPRSSDMDAVGKAADGITLATDGGGTHFESASKYLLNEVLEKTSRGDGSSEARPKVFVMIITDGVESYLSYSGGKWNPLPHTSYLPSAGYSLPDGDGIERAWYLQALNPAFCDRLKLSNVKVVPLQVTYIVPETEFQDADVRFPWIEMNLLKGDHVNKSFTDCASDKSQAFKGTTPAEITGSLVEMFRITLPRNARLAK